MRSRLKRLLREPFRVFGRTCRPDAGGRKLRHVRNPAKITVFGVQQVPLRRRPHSRAIPRERQQHVIVRTIQSRLPHHVRHRTASATRSRRRSASGHSRGDEGGRRDGRSPGRARARRRASVSRSSPAFFRMRTPRCRPPSSRARAHSDAYARAGDQVSANMTQYAADTPLRVGVVYGGVDIRPQSDMLRRGVEILTATPRAVCLTISSSARRISLRSRSSCSTRLTACSTWASCLTSAASSSFCRPTVRV